MYLDPVSKFEIANSMHLARVQAAEHHTSPDALRRVRPLRATARPWARRHLR
jgi:hypothetical protein